MGRDWDDLAALLGSGGFADLFSSPAQPPPDWEPGVVRLGAPEVAEMLALVERTRPGPFWERTIAMGTYVGIRDGGRLVAMAGERLRPPGWTDVSAVCTAPEARGQGCAGRLVRHLVGEVLDRGERAFLHVSTENHGAIELYERLGFTRRRAVRFHGYRVP